MSLIAAGARLERAARDLGREGVGGDRHPDRRPRPSIAGTSFAASSSAATGGPAAGGDRADVEQLEARLDEREPVGDRLLGRAAARALEERVVGDVDDPGRQRRLSSRARGRPVASGSSRLR